MNLAQQRRIVAVSAMVVFALGFLSHARKGQLPTARFLIGTGGLYTIISIFTDLGLAIGAGMSIVVLITATLTEGGPVIKLLNERGGFPSEGKAKAPKVTEEVAPGVIETSPLYGPRVNTAIEHKPVLGPPVPHNPFIVPTLGGH